MLPFLLSFVDFDASPEVYARWASQQHQQRQPQRKQQQPASGWAGQREPLVLSGCSRHVALSDATGKSDCN